jgi:hypothetical protein
MTDVVRLYAQIALLRRGPQDVPASALLLAATILAYCIINSVAAWALPTLAGPWFRLLLTDVVFTLAWYGALLFLTRRPERFMQTTTAVFGYRAVMSPLSIASEWLIRRFGEDAVWQLPLGVVYTAIVLWMIAANSQVLKAALEWSMPACVALVILEILADWLVVFSLVPLPR